VALHPRPAHLATRGHHRNSAQTKGRVNPKRLDRRRILGSRLCAQQGVSLAGESPAAPSQGGCVDKRPGRTRRPRVHKTRGGQGVHREVESEGLASNPRAVAEARARRTGRPRACSSEPAALRRRKYLRSPLQDTVCADGTEGTEKRLTWGGLVASSVRVFMLPARGRRAGGVGPAIRRSPKRRADAQREVRASIVVRNRGESRGTHAGVRGDGGGAKAPGPGAKGGHREGATGCGRG
jgi:hypothetical protein